jgi:drug/metabolite transporter (DMT)-like permease
MLALTPLFLLFSGFLINGEFPTSLGLGGVALIIAGTYLLNFKKNAQSIFEPFQVIFNNSGSVLMLGVAIIWGITGSLHKLAISHSNPYFYTGLGALVLTTLYTPVAWYANREDFKKSLSREYLPQLVPIGLLDGITILAQFIGQSMSLTVLVISLKRTSIIFSSLLSWYFFKEEIGPRLLPICLMVLGVMLIAIS